MPDLPEAYIGVTEVRQSTFFGLFKQRRKIGFEFRRCGELQHGTDTVEFDVEVDIFVNPPTLLVPDGGVMKVNLREQVVTFDSSYGKLKLRGKLSTDMQRIEGTVDIHNFQLMDVAGDFVNSSITLKATEVEPNEA